MTLAKMTNFLGLWSFSCGSNNALWHGSTLEAAAKEWQRLVAAHPGEEVDLTAYGRGEVASHREMEWRYGTPKASFACPICGKETPHEHTGEAIAWHRDMEAWKRRDMEKRWERIEARIEARIAELAALNAPDGVLGTLKETHEQTAKEDTRAHEVLRNEAEVRDFGAGAGSVAPGSLGLHASLQVPQVWEVSLRAPEPSKAQANEVLTGTPGVKVPAPAGHILSPPSEEEAEAESLLDHLAACRDAFPLPEPGTPLEQLWAAAMGDPHCVAAYVKAAAGVLGTLKEGDHG